ncbi:thiamine phosphate synthase [Pustulibacterium marinum]|nr:thiamine phosphate synthase [Pustulibacterium marinum]
MNLPNPKLIVMTNPDEYPNEGMHISAMFREGLECLHLRKPNWTAAQLQALLAQIPTEYYERIKLHGHYQLVPQMSLGGIHLTESTKASFDREIYSGIAISASFHTPEAVIRSELPLQYAFLSPVFTSISKKDYAGKGFTAPKASFPVIALGGITEETLPKAFALGYEGIAVLGSVWGSAHPVTAYKTLAAQCLELL